jgi:hypothetical protein
MRNKADIITENGKIVIWKKFTRREKIKLSLLCLGLGVFIGFIISAIMYFVLFPPVASMYIVIE